MNFYWTDLSVGFYSSHLLTSLSSLHRIYIEMTILVLNVFVNILHTSFSSQIILVYKQRMKILLKYSIITKEDVIHFSQHWPDKSLIRQMICFYFRSYLNWNLFFSTICTDSRISILTSLQSEIDDKKKKFLIQQGSTTTCSLNVYVQRDCIQKDRGVTKWKEADGNQMCAFLDILLLCRLCFIKVR